MGCALGDTERDIIKGDIETKKKCPLFPRISQFEWQRQTGNQHQLHVMFQLTYLRVTVASVRPEHLKLLKELESQVQENPLKGPCIMSRKICS